MTLKEAYKILGASKQDDDREIKAKYKKIQEIGEAMDNNNQVTNKLSDSTKKFINV